MDIQALTLKQKDVLKFILRYLRLHGHPPTIREIGGGLNFSSTGTVRDYLKILSRKGYINIRQNKSRAIEVIKNTAFSISILGRVTAGHPDFAVENIEGYIDWDNLLAAEDTFALHVKGDSMIERGIMEGDLVLVRQQQTAAIGDIIVALLNSNEATIKILKKKEDKLYLEPANKNYPPIYTEFNIIGKVMGLIRRYK